MMQPMLFTASRLISRPIAQWDNQIIVSLQCRQNGERLTDVEPIQPGSFQPQSK